MRMNPNNSNSKNQISNSKTGMFGICNLNIGILKICLVAVIFFITSAFSSPVVKTNGRAIVPDVCSTQNNTFESGEKLVYKLFYNWGYLWLAAGEVEFTVKDLGEEYHLSAVGKTYSSYEWFFKVRDHYQAFIDKETLLPKRSIRKVKEGGYQLYEEMDFDQEGRKITSNRGKFEDKTKKGVFAVDDCMHDVLSIIYYLRNIDQETLAANDYVNMKIFMDKKPWELKLTYKGKQKSKKIKGLGKFNTLAISPELITGDVFPEGSEMRVFASDDQNRIPLMIESPVSVGSVKAVLKSYSGLKYDLEKQ